MARLVPRAKLFEKTLRFGIAIVFICAAGVKLFNINSGHTVFTSLPLVVRLAVIAIELAVGAWLLSGRHHRLATIATLIALSIFAGVILHEMREDHPQPCGCLGPSYAAEHNPEVIQRRLEASLAFDLLLMAGTIAIFYIGPRNRCVIGVQQGVAVKGVT